MTAFKVASENPLDDLVVRVYHLDISDCESFSEFKEIVQLMLANYRRGIKSAEELFFGRPVRNSCSRAPHVSSHPTS